MDLKFLNISNNSMEEIKKYKYHYLSLVLCFLMIGYFIIQIHYNINTNEGDILTVINSIYTSLILALISLITIIASSLNNKKILNQNEESRFIQLRFKESKESIYDLIEYLQKTCTIYKQLNRFLKNNEDKEEYFISPKAFLVMQFIFLISNTQLLNKLPLHIRSKIQFEFEDKVEYGWNEESEEVLKDIEFPFSFFAHPVYFDTLSVYEDCLNSFRTMPYYEYNRVLFKIYYSSEISEEEYLSHFINVLNEISSTKLEDLILKDKRIVLNELHYEDYFEEYIKEEKDL